MQVHVTLYGMLRQYRPVTAVGAAHHPFTITLPDEGAIGDLLHELEIPADIVVAALNGQTVELDAPLTPQDNLSLFPPTAGG